MNLKAWVAPSLVALVSLGIGSFATYKVVQHSQGSMAVMSFNIPDCSNGTDFIHGDIAIPEHDTTPAYLNRVVCPGDTVFWHDQLNRTLAVDFGSSTGCTTGATFVGNPTSGPESFIKVTAVSVSAIVHCTYRLTATDSSGKISKFNPAHIIIIK